MIVLPWPHKDLNPNSRKQHRHLTDVRASAKSTGFYAAKEAKMNFAHMADVGLHLRITFHPPDARARDLDNCLASIKSHLDGVAMAVGVDDSKWELTIRKADPIRPNGEVRIEVIQPIREAVIFGSDAPVKQEKSA